MGVKDLWQLLGPIGRRVSIETLDGKVLAIDMSIWLTQFVKAMRDEEGKLVKNAHIIGTLRRILKLLFHRIKPVFVFDGQTPALKLRVIQSRRKTHERHEASRKAAVHRMIMAQLKQQLIQSSEAPASHQGTKLPSRRDVSSISQPSNLVPGFNPGAINSSSFEPASAELAQTEQVDDDHEDNQEFSIRWTDGSDLPKTKALDEGEDDSEDDDDPLFSLPENHQDLNVDVLSSLPSHIRKRIIEDARRRERMRSRATYMPVADNPTLYSQTQLANFLSTSKLNRRFEEAQRLVEGVDETEGRRIAGEGKKKFSFVPRSQVSRFQESQPVDTKRAPTGTADDSDDEFTSSDWQNKSSEAYSKSLFQDPQLGKRSREAVEEVYQPSKLRRLVKKVENAEQGDGGVDDGENSNNQDHQRDVSNEGRKAALRNPFFDDDLEDGVDEQHDDCSESEGRGGGFIVDDVDDSEPVNSNETAEFEEAVVESSSPIVEEPKVTGSAITAASTLGGNHTSADYFEQQALAREAREFQHIMWEEDDDNSGGNIDPDVTDIQWENDEDAIPTTETIVIDVSGAGDDVLKSSPDVVVHVDDDPLVDFHGNNDHDYDARGFTSSDASFTATQSTQADDAIQRAITTASSMADWAGRAVRRALKEHISNSTSNAPAASMQTEPPVLLKPSASISNAVSTTPNKSSTSFSALSQASQQHKHLIVSPSDTMLSQPGIEEDVSSSKAAAAIIKHEHNDSSIDYVDVSGDVDVVDAMKGVGMSVVDVDGDGELDLEQLKKTLASTARDTERVTEEMKSEVIALIQAFELPFIVAPYEAEAQCAVLEELGLVDGVITEDSDALLFGAKAVYKNIFSDRKFVEVYLAEDAQRELGLSRDDLVALAFFLGSDYTEGVHGVGIVNAMEVLQAFPMKAASGGPIEGLRKFRRWLEGYDFAKDILEELERNKAASTASASGKQSKRKAVVQKKKSKLSDDPMQVDAFEDSEDEDVDVVENIEDYSSDDEDKHSSAVVLRDDETKLINFDKKHKTGRSKWTVPANFPDSKVAEAYFHPNTNRNTTPFPFPQPSRSKVRQFCSEILGWTEAQMNAQVDPVLQRYAERSTQTRIDGHFLTYHDNTRFAKIASERLKDAVVQITGKTSSEVVGVPRRRARQTGTRKRKAEEAKEDNST